MKTLKVKTNINCGNCVAKVTPYLDAAPDIEHWQVDTAHADKILTAHGQALTPERVAEILAPSGFKVLGHAPQAAVLPQTEAETRPHTPNHAHQAMNLIPEEEDTRGPLETYKPLLLVLGYLLGGVLLREWVAGDAFPWGGRWDAHLMMQNFMGGFFIAFSFFKMLDLAGFATSYRMYDLVAARIPAWGRVYPFVELALGILYLAGIAPVWTNAITLVLMLAGLAGVWNSLRQKRAIRCACLGTGFNLPMSTVTLIEDGAMAAMAAAMLAW